MRTLRAVYNHARRRACELISPSLNARATVLRRFERPLGNADAHAKNYSLLYRPGGIDLAPLYDLLCTATYPQAHNKLAMKVGRRGILEEFQPDTWEEFAREVGMGAPFVRRRALALAERALAVLEPVATDIAAAGFGGEHLEHAARTIAGRAEMLKALGEQRRG